MFCLTAKLLQVKVYKRRSKYVNWPNFPPGEKDINEISKPKNYFITKKNCACRFGVSYSRSILSAEQF